MGNTAIVAKSADESIAPKIVPINESEVDRRRNKRGERGIKPHSVVNLAQLYRERLLCGGVLPTEIRRSAKLSDGLKILISAMIEIQATNPEVRPKVASLAREIGKSKDQTRRLIHEGERKGLLRVEHRRSPEAPSLNLPSIYEFLYEPSIFDASADERETPKRRPSKSTQGTGIPASTCTSARRCTGASAPTLPVSLQGGVLAEMLPISNTSSSTPTTNTNLTPTPPPALDFTRPSQSCGGGGGDNKPQSKQKERGHPESDEDLDLTWEDREAGQRIERKSGLSFVIDGPTLVCIKRMLGEYDSTLRTLACLVTPEMFAGSANPIGLLRYKIGQRQSFSALYDAADLPACELCEDTGDFRDPDFVRDLPATYYCDECDEGPRLQAKHRAAEKAHLWNERVPAHSVKYWWPQLEEKWAETVPDMGESFNTWLAACSDLSKSMVDRGEVSHPDFTLQFALDHWEDIVRAREDSDACL